MRMARSRLPLLTFLPLMLAFATTVTSQGPSKTDPRILPYPGPYYGNLNASSIYDPSSEKCCRGSVHQFGSRGIDKCCDTQTYDSTRQMCCGGKVHQLQLGYACCGQNTYDTDSGVCCNDVVIQTNGGNNQKLSCCGNSTYKATSELCCYDDNFQPIVVRSVPPGHSCCGKQSYDPGTQICCPFSNSNIIVSQGGVNNPACCGDRVYDFTTHGCCNDEVYDQRKKTCCYDGSRTFTKAIRKPGELCCGTSGDVYDPNTQVCCGNSILDKKSEQQEYCCGDNRTYDYSKQLCCYDDTGSSPSVVKKRQSTDDVCCGGRVPYTFSKSVCCDGKVHGNTDGVCCQTNDGKQIFQRVNSTTYGCCGSNAYNYQTQGCCGTDVYDLKTQTCCYDSSSDGELKGYVLDDYRPGMACCGRKLYNYSDNKGCCGRTTYDTRRQVCCGSNVIDQGASGRATCCFSFITDENCGGSLYPYGPGPVVLKEKK